MKKLIGLSILAFSLQSQAADLNCYHPVNQVASNTNEVCLSKVSVNDADKKVDVNVSYVVEKNTEDFINKDLSLNIISEAKKDDMSIVVSQGYFRSYEVQSPDGAPLIENSTLKLVVKLNAQNQVDENSITMSEVRANHETIFTNGK